MPLSETVSIDVRDESLYNILCSIAAQRDLVFQRINRQIILKKSKVERSQPPIQKSTGVVKGKVTDAVTGDPLIGANIMVKGTRIGATTDILW